MLNYMATVQNFFSKLFGGNRKRDQSGAFKNGVNYFGKFDNSKFEYTPHYIEQQLQIFMKLLDDEAIEELMSHDICRKLTDKYLLAMVFVYFLRANLRPSDFTRQNFFSALLLAVDMEEEDLAIRDELFYWALEDRKFSLDDLHARKDNLWHAMDFRAAVSMKSCHDVMSVLPTLSIWRRQRPLRHAGAVRKPAGSQSSIGTAFFNCSGCRDELQDESMSFESSSSLSTQQQCRCFRCSCASSPELLSEVSSPPSKKAATDDHHVEFRLQQSEE